MVEKIYGTWVLSLEWNSECVMEGESGEQVGGELESVTSSAGCFMQGWRKVYKFLLSYRSVGGICWS